MADKTQAQLQTDIDTLLVNNTTGDVTVPALNTLLTDITQSVDGRVLSSTGLYTGATISAGGTTGTIDIAAGEGFTNDTSAYPVITPAEVIISARTNMALPDILTQPVTYIMVTTADAILTLSAFPTAEQKRDNIFLGVAVHSDNVNINAVNNIPDVALDATAQIHDVMAGLGFFNLAGNVIANNGANLSIDKSAGTAFKAGANFAVNHKDPHTLTLAIQTLATFRYRNQDSTEGSDITVIDPTNYDLAGTTTAIAGSNNQATIQRVYIFPSGIIRVQRGQEIFATLSAAVNTVGKEAFVVEPNIDENGLLLASLVVTKGATDLSTTSTALFFKASRFGELGSVGSSAATTLQQALDNSIDPEMEAASGTAVSFKTATDGAQIILDVKDELDAVNFSVTGDGVVRNTVKQRTITTASPTAILATDGTILFDPASNVIGIDLPAASVGKVAIPFKDVGGNSSTNNITINRAGSDTIVDSATGQTSTIIASDGFSGYFLSNGVDTWYLL